MNSYESIEKLGLIVRTQNVLKSEGIYTINDLLNTNPKKLRKFVNFGAKSFDEVVTAMKKHGYAKWVEQADGFVKPNQAPLKPPASEIYLRDYFAGIAMQAILENQYQDGIYVGDFDNESEIDCAMSAYIVADAMMKYRLVKLEK